MPYKLYTSLIDFLKTSAGAQIKACLIDIDGTLKIGTTPIPTASRAIYFLEEHKLPYLLITNDSSISTTCKIEALQKMGIPVQNEKILSCADLIKSYVDKNDLHGKKVFVLGNLGSPCFAETAGLKVIRDPALAFECLGVIISELGYDWESSINKAVNIFITNPDAFLLAPNPDKYWRSHNCNGINIGAGAIVDLIVQTLKEVCIEVTPIYLGKPTTAFFTKCLEKLGFLMSNLQEINPKNVLVIGDSLKGDMLGANMAGMISGLVMTGATTWKHLSEEMTDSLKPLIVFNNI